MTVAFGPIDTLNPDRALIVGRDDVVRFCHEAEPQTAHLLLG